MNWLKNIFTLLMIVCLIILFRFSYYKQKSSLCKQVIIEISDFDNSLITIDEVNDLNRYIEQNVN